MELAPDTIAIVASNLTAALCATGQHRVSDADTIGDVLHIYWKFAAELEEAQSREAAAQR